MVQCEMCGVETAAPTTAKIEGAELEVCDECAEFGTTIQTSESETTTTKYSTSSSESSGSSGQQPRSTSRSSSSSSESSQSRRDMFDEMDEIATDYDTRIRQAREAADLSQAELADQLNEKRSFIRKLERGESLPSDQIRRKLERALDIDLTEGGSGDEDTEWSAEDTASGVTLGDIVERKE